MQITSLGKRIEGMNRMEARQVESFSLFGSHSDQIRDLISSHMCDITTPMVAATASGMNG